MNVNLGDSPCKKQCRVDWDYEACSTCGRTLSDLTNWSKMNLLERVLANAKAIRVLRRMEKMNGR